MRLPAGGVGRRGHLGLRGRRRCFLSPPPPPSTPADARDDERGHRSDHREQPEDREATPPPASPRRLPPPVPQLLRELGQIAVVVAERIGHDGESSECRDRLGRPSVGGSRAPPEAPPEAPPRRRSPRRPASPCIASARPSPIAGPSGMPAAEQVVAVDLEADPAPLRDVAVEPLRAQRPGQRQLDARAPARQLHPLGGARRARLGQAPSLLDPRARAPRPAPPRRVARPPATGPRRPARRRPRRARRHPAPATAGPIRTSSAKTPSPPRARRRAFEARPLAIR